MCRWISSVAERKNVRERERESEKTNPFFLRSNTQTITFFFFLFLFLIMVKPCITGRRKPRNWIRKIKFIIFF